jgi:hypothetical protein
MTDAWDLCGDRGTRDWTGTRYLSYGRRQGEHAGQHHSQRAEVPTRLYDDIAREDGVV